jgi:hypothetical protein
MNYFRLLFLQARVSERQAYVAYKRIALVTGLAILIGYIFNLIGLGLINAIIGIALNVGLISVAIKYSRTSIVATGVGGLWGYLSSSKEDRENGNSENVIIVAVSKYMLYASMYFLAASIHSFKGTGGIVFIAIMAFICLAWMDIAWNYNPRIFKPLAFTYCCIVNIWVVVVIIQPSTYTAVFGNDIVSSLRPGEFSEALNKVSKAKDNRKLNQAIKRLEDANAIAEKDPSEANEKAVDDAAEALKKLSVVGKVSSIFSSSKKVATTVTETKTDLPGIPITKDMSPYSFQAGNKYRMDTKSLKQTGQIAFSSVKTSYFDVLPKSPNYIINYSDGTFYRGDKERPHKYGKDLQINIKVLNDKAPEHLYIEII